MSIVLILKHTIQLLILKFYCKKIYIFSVYSIIAAHNFLLKILAMCRCQVTRYWLNMMEHTVNRIKWFTACCKRALILNLSE